MADPIALSPATLGTLSRRVRVPQYDREAVAPRIVHFGVGGFHRAHQAVYADDLLGAGVGDWGIVGAGVLERDNAMRDALVPQGYLYTVVDQSPEAVNARVVGSILDYRHAFDDPQGLLDLLSRPEVKIVSLTVTEGGYHYDFGRHNLREDDAAIENDRLGAVPPQTWIGYVVHALRARRDSGIEPFTVLSCDNIPNNGTVARTVVLELADDIGPGLYEFIESNVAFPCTMVDRITPQTTDADRQRLQTEFGIVDAWPVFCESFRQWVIEDEFPSGRPRWEEVGVQITDDVYPYELAKIRLLNGAHSALSYAALLMGYERVDAAMADPLILRLVETYMAEVRPTLPPVVGWDLSEYCAVLVSRFSNPAIADQVARLAQDGSTKIANSVAPAARDAVVRGSLPQAVCLAVAAWIVYCREQQGIDDPAADSLRDAARRCTEEAGPFLDQEWIFPPQLSKAPAFRDTVSRALRTITERGIRSPELWKSIAESSQYRG